MCWREWKSREALREEQILEKCTLQNTPKLTFEGTTLSAKVLDVYDGDTITIAFLFHRKPYQEKVRLYGIDTPEVKTRDLEEKNAGLKARDFLRLLIVEQIIQVECKGWDKYGRMLGVVKYRGENVNELMVNKGYGRVYQI